jgi:hypothetical protein
MLCAWTRSHVWHMKVLLYAVFKERGLSIERRRSHRIRANGRSPMSGPSKLNSAVPTNGSTSEPIVLRETLVRGPRNRC